MSWIIFICLLVAIHSLSAPEQDALCAIINSMSNQSIPDDWVCSQASQGCNWTGINCSEDSIVRLILVGKSTQVYNGRIPSQIGQLESLTQLVLTALGLSGTIPCELHNLTKLQHLQANNNNLTGRVCLPPNIQQVELRANHFLRMPRFPPTIVGIDVSSNWIQGTIPNASFGPHLTTLNIFANDMNGSVPGWALNLSYLDGSFNRFSHFPVDQILTGMILLLPQESNECQEMTHACNYSCVDGWFPALDYTCGCPDGQALRADRRNCQPCLGDLEPVELEDHASFPTMALEYPAAELEQPYVSCSSCDYGRRYSSRTIVFDTACLKYAGDTIDVEPCEFACSNLTDVVGAKESIRTLVTQFQKENGQFLENIFKTIFGTTLHFISESYHRSSKKRILGIDFLDWFLVFDTFSIQIDVCNGSTPLSQMADLVEGLAYDIVPNIPSLTVKTSRSYVGSAEWSCLITLKSQDPDPITPIVLAIVITSVFLMCCLGCCIWFCVYRANYLKSPLRQLPKDVAWSYLKYEKQPRKWDHRGTKHNKYYFKEFPLDSKGGQRVMHLFNTFLHGSQLVVNKIEAVYNEQLTANFVNQRNFLRQRTLAAPDVFAPDTTEGNEIRNWVLSKYIGLVSQFSWNNTSTREQTCMAILPAIHGTDMATARSIAETGFAAVSLLDAGFFGKGIYFTTFANYTIPYFSSRRDPAIIISWIVCGSAFPVIEAADGPHTRKGAALHGTANAHFVVTDRHGQCLADPKADPTECFNEIVIGQEPQITPAFILSISKDNIPALLKKWNRLIPVEEFSSVSKGEDDSLLSHG